MRARLIATIGATAAALGTGAAWAGDAEAGKARYLQNCVACHGKAGKGMASFPAIVDRDADYIADRLEQYRAREKVGPNSAIMMSLASELSDDDIANLATYIAEAFGPAPKEEKKEEEAAFDATGTMTCAQEKDQPMGECAYGVLRGEDGTATVVVTFPNGFSRKLFFEDGEFVKADATMSGNGTDTDWETRTIHSIRVDDQRYELEEEAIFGE